MINKILWNVNDVVWLIFEVIAAIGAFLSIMDLIKKKENRNSRIAIIVVFIVISVLTIYSYSLVKVPNIIDLRYEDACILLTQNDLRYPVDATDDNLYVIAQSVEAGQIVRRQTVVEMELEKITNSNQQEIIDKLRKEGVPFRDLHLIYYDEEIEVSQNGERIHLLGTAIQELNIESITLTNTDYNLEFKEYKIEQKEIYGEEKTVVIFEDIPSGYYKLTSRLHGYENLITKEIKLSIQWLQGNVHEDEKYWGANIYVYSNKSDSMRPYEIMVVDDKGNKVDNLVCTLHYQNENILYGDYEIHDGLIPLQFYAPKGSRVIIGFFNQSRTDIEVSCEVVFDDVFDNPVIVLNKDGTAVQKKRTEVFGY